MTPQTTKQAIQKKKTFISITMETKKRIVGFRQLH